MKKLTGIFVLSIFLCNSVFTQDAVTGDILQRFDQYRTTALQEKLFVHTDKSFYLAGEVCWFKVYDVDGSFHKPLDLSRIAYAELLTADHKPVLQAKISIEGGSGCGSFLIPFSMQSGNYIFRAYTNWMKNFSPDFYFEKQVTVINVLKKPVWDAHDSITAFHAQFFPEGGNLVNGIKSLIAFKVNDNAQKGIDCKGAIVNQNNDTVARFKTLRFGMGKFYFTPVKEDVYRAVITIPNNSIVTVEMPAINKEGYVMHLENIDREQVKISITANGARSGSQVSLFVHTRLSVKAVSSTSITNGLAGFVINKNILGDGISHFTLFDDQQRPLCERIYFKRPEQALHVNISNDRSAYSKREKVTISLNVNDGKNQPVSSDLSFAVALADSLTNFGDENDILSYLWLSSDLKGMIENPSYYFNDTAVEVTEAADNLMLTQGWRRFDWNKVLRNTQPVIDFLPEYDGHIINGTVSYRKSGMPAGNIATYLSVAGKPFRFNSSISNSKGQMLFDVKDFYGTSEMILQTDNSIDSNYRIDIANPFSDKFSTTPVPSFAVSESMRDILAQRSTSTQVQQVYSADQLNRFYTDNSQDTSLFFSGKQKTYLLDDYTRFVTMEEVIREYVKEIRLRKGHEQYYLKIRSSDKEFDGTPLVLLDGVPVFNINKLVELDPLKISKIDVLPGRYYYGSLITDGIVSYSSYDGDLAGFNLDPSSVIIDYLGLQLQREFYEPVYKTPEQVGSRLPDFRNVLYWEPYAGTGTDAKRSVSFYTGDVPGNYEVIVQGITQEGLAGSTTWKFSVK